MLPGASERKVKLTFADRSGIVLGGQVSGGPSADELINGIALAIQKIEFKTGQFWVHGKAGLLFSGVRQHRIRSGHLPNGMPSNMLF